MDESSDDSRDATVAAQLAEQDNKNMRIFIPPLNRIHTVAFCGCCVNLGRSNRGTGKGHFRFSRLQWMPWRERGRCHWHRLKHITAQYPPAQLTALLKAPRANMTAAGMVPLTLDSGQMTALVSYLGSLGGTSAASAAAPPASGSTSPEPDQMWPPESRKRKLEVHQATQPSPRGRLFLILTAAADAMGRAERVALDHR